ncbi:MAG: CPBP family intramembrane glutamic endopeptidase, partial [Ignavibacteriaceae bacterium]
MEQSRKKISLLVIGLSVGLLFMGALRYSSSHPNILTPLSNYATLGYILISVVFTIILFRAGLPLNRFGFGIRPDLKQLLLAISAIVLLRLFAWGLEPFIEAIVGGSRNLERFSDIEGSTSSLIGLLMMSWTIAAFGEEFIYRIVLMRGISFIFNDTRQAQIAAVILQALLFGLIHAYQGPAGIIGATFSGLVFGAVTIASRWSIWPSAIAHGTNNTIGIIALYMG